MIHSIRFFINNSLVGDFGKKFLEDIKDTDTLQILLKILCIDRGARFNSTRRRTGCTDGERGDRRSCVFCLKKSRLVRRRISLGLSHYVECYRFPIFVFRLIGNAVASHGGLFCFSAEVNTIFERKHNHEKDPRTCTRYGNASRNYLLLRRSLRS